VALVKSIVIGVLVGLILFAWGLPTLGALLISPKRYLDVTSVTVSDSTAGVPPAIMPNRRIVRDFTGEWSVYVRALSEDGYTFGYCLAHSVRAGRYYADSGPVLDRDMDWWMAIPPNAPCPWEPGRYLVRTEWTILLPLGIRLRVENQSNVFTVTEG
jgi:hypothetical protein